MELLMKELARFLDSHPTPSEARLISEASRGEPIDYSDKNPEMNDPEKAEGWEEARTVRARCIEWLLTAKQGQDQISRRGLRIQGAKVLGGLNLENGNLPFPIEFRACAFDKSIALQQAHLKSLDLSGSHIHGLDAQSIRITHDVSLRCGFKVEGRVSLHGATIGGALDCSEGEFLNANGDAIYAQNVRVTGDVFLRDGFKAEGQVNLYGATIGGTLDCSEGEFLNPDSSALIAVDMKVGASVVLRDGFKAEGQVNLYGATIGGELDCSKGNFLNPDGEALTATGIKVRGSVLLRDGFKAEGQVNLYEATIGGTLDCSEGEFLNANGDAIYAENVKIKGDVFLRDGFKAEGQVNLYGATIGGELDCSKGNFLNPDGKALTATGIKVGGSVLLRDGFKAEGQVDLYGATFGSTLDCSTGKFLNPGGDALFAESVQVTGSIFLRYGFKAEGRVSLFGATVGSTLNCSKGEFLNPDGDALIAQGMKAGDSILLRGGFKAEGQVDLYGATIGGELDCSEGEFLNPDGDALIVQGTKITDDVYLMDGFKADGRVDLSRATISGVLKWSDTMEPKQTTMDLRNARARVLADAADSWPLNGNLYLYGFRYDEIDDEAPREAKERIRWLRLQPETPFRLQPYEQLAKVLREGGHERAAKQIHIAKNDDRLRWGDVSSMAKPLHGLLKLVTGYGYKPWRPMMIALLVIAFGWGLFSAGSRESIIMSTNGTRFTSTDGRQAEPVHSSFHPLLYSLDVFLPVINFDHADNWAPNEKATGHLIWAIPLSGLALRSYEWFMNLAGWILTTLFITTLTGTIRRRLG